MVVNMVINGWELIELEDIKEFYKMNIFNKSETICGYV